VSRVLRKYGVKSDTILQNVRSGFWRRKKIHENSDLRGIHAIRRRGLQAIHLHSTDAILCDASFSSTRHRSVEETSDKNETRTTKEEIR